MKSLFVFIFIFIALSKLFAQTISGFVSDKQTGEKLIGANILITNTLQGTATDNQGYFTLRTPNTDSVKFEVSYVGYKTYTAIADVSKKRIINIELEHTNEIEEVIVSANKDIHRNTETGLLQLSMKGIENLPTLSGETDALKAFQLMPGVQTGTEGTSALYVRGGTPDQNLILLDDVPVYYVNHVGGFLSVFDENAINTMKLYKGGFPAQYSGRVSSVLDIRMNEGNTDETTGEFQVGIIASKVFAKIPFDNHKTSAMLSLRRANTDIYSRLLSIATDDSYIGGIGFYDVYTKIKHRFSDKSNMCFSIYSGRDRVFLNGKEKESYSMMMTATLYEYKLKWNNKWGNNLTAVNWNYIFTPAFSMRLTTAATLFHYQNKLDIQEIETHTKKLTGRSTSDYQSGIANIMFKSDFSYRRFKNHTISFGTGSFYHIFTPGATHYYKADNEVENDIVYGFTNINALENYFYIDDRFSATKWLSLYAGLHINSYIVKNKTYNSIQPRLITNIRFAKHLSTKLSYTKMLQYNHLLSSTNIGMPTEIWIPSDEEIKPVHSDIYAIEIDKTFEKQPYSIVIEAYYKTYNNLIDFQDGASMYSSVDSWNSYIETNGNGLSYGFEVLLQKTSGIINGWVSYTYSHSERQFARLNNGNSFLFSFDRPHNLNIVSVYKFNKNISITANWTFMSGLPLTIAQSHFKLPVDLYQNKEVDFNPDGSLMHPHITPLLTAHYYGSRNNVRMPAHHRLDISLTWKRLTKKRKQSEWRFGLYNAYNRMNSYFLYYKQKNNQYQFQKFTMFPIIPSFSYSLKF